MPQLFSRNFEVNLRSWMSEAATSYEGNIIHEQLSQFKMVVLVDFRAITLEMFNQVSKSTQHETMELQSAMKHFIPLPDIFYITAGPV